MYVNTGYGTPNMLILAYHYNYQFLREIVVLLLRRFVDFHLLNATIQMLSRNLFVYKNVEMAKRRLSRNIFEIHDYITIQFNFESKVSVNT